MRLSHDSASVLSKALSRVAPRLAVWRRDLHTYPEPGWMEFRTASLVIQRLRELGYRICMGKEATSEHSRTGCPSEAELKQAQERAITEGADAELVSLMQGGFTAFWADLECGEGPLIGLRFDMDCNELTESIEPAHRPVREAFASRHPGLMHACGHDGHVAVGLGIAEVLAALRPALRGTIRLLFQPAEEGGRGALPMLEAGSVQGMDTLLGFHIGFKAASGEVICGTRNFLATTKRDILFKGAPAHAGAAPEEGRNALLAACTATLNLHAIPRNAKGDTRITVGRLEGGEARNIIPALARLQIETRGTTSALNAYMDGEAKRIISAAAAMWGCTCENTLVGTIDGGESSPSLAAHIAAIARLMPSFPVVTEINDFGATEDFACLMTNVQEQGGQASYLQIGTTRSAGHHHALFDFDEACLFSATELLARIVCSLSGILSNETKETIKIHETFND